MEHQTSLDLVVIASTLGIFAAVVVSPGPNFALISRLALQGHRTAANGAVAGFVAGSAVYALLAMVGLSAILSQVGWLARGVQIAGGLYLVYLGLNAWWSTRGTRTGVKEDTRNELPQPGFRNGLKLGLIIELSNPKGIAFFVGLYAAAVPLDASIGTKASIFVGGALIQLAWYAVVVSVLSGTRFCAFYERGRKWIERTIGSALVFFGLRLIVSD